MGGLCAGMMLALWMALPQVAAAGNRVHVRQMSPDALHLAVTEAARDMRGLRRIWCVPFARAVSGIGIRGNAWTWWDGAGTEYPKGQVPVAGSVLTFRKTGRMPMGHVAVVSRVVDPRRITVDQANWVRNRITTDTTVIDVSPDNDWSRVRVENGQNGFGAVYPTYGFIYRAADGS